MAGPGDHCACPRLDAADCMSFRHPHPLGERIPSDEQERCECPCHDDNAPDDDFDPEED